MPRHACSSTELYLPGGKGPWPLVEFAHGFNGDPSKFTQLFGAWADAGFAVLAPRFPITYTDAGTNPLGRATDIAQQPADMRFVLRKVLAGQYASRIDAHRIGVAGLSLGGGTTWGLISDRCCIERRYRAAIVMDGNRFGFGPTTFVPTTIPLMVLHIRTDIALPFQAARGRVRAGVAAQVLRDHLPGCAPGALREPAEHRGRDGDAGDRRVLACVPAR